MDVAPLARQRPELATIWSSPVLLVAAIHWLSRRIKAREASACGPTLTRRASAKIPRKRGARPSDSGSTCLTSALQVSPLSRLYTNDRGPLRPTIWFQEVPESKTSNRVWDVSLDWPPFEGAGEPATTAEVTA